jgi:hypothetical protein
MNSIFTIIIEVLFVKLGAGIRWTLSNKKRSLEEFEEDDGSNLIVSIATIAVVIFLIVIIF